MYKHKGISTRNKPAVIAKSSIAGITLIALVVTIIVLLVLAGVSINMLMGENGIINQSQKAKQQNKVQKIEEQVRLAVMAAKAEGLGNVDYDMLNAELQKIGNEENITVLPASVKIDGVLVEIDENGNTKASLLENKEEQEQEPEPEPEPDVEPTTLAESKAKESDVSVNTTFQDTNGDSITIPEGFNVDKDSPIIVTEGIVIEDSYENQYVWVPVFEKSDARDWGIDYATAGVTTAKTGTYEQFESAGDFSKLASALKTYTSDYKVDSCSDVWYGDANYGKNGYYAETDTAQTKLLYYTNGNMTEEKYEELYNNMLISIYKNGGFYIGRYEMGIGVVEETQEKTALEVAEELLRDEMTEYVASSTEAENEAPTIEGMITPISKANAVGYSNITQSQAQMLAEKVKVEYGYGNITSSLMFGVQWDAVCVFMENYGKINGETQLDFNYLDDSDYGKYWGNHANATFAMNRGYYNEYDDEFLGWKAQAEKKETGYWLCTTGASDQNSALNIYDFGGNLGEFTLERTNLATHPVVPRGGMFDQNGAPAHRILYTTSGGSLYYTSRVMMYL